MALSNMLNEPRREITETVVGIGGVGGIIALIYPIARQLTVAVDGPDVLASPHYWSELGVALLLTVLGLAVFIVVLAIIHASGDAICNWFDDHGLRLRPTQRYR